MASRTRYLRAVFLALGLLLFVYLLIRLGAEQVVAAVLRLGWTFPGMAALFALHQLARAAAYWHCTGEDGGPGYWEVVRIRAAGEVIRSMTFTGPLLAEPAKVWLLRQSGLETKRAVAATAAEYLLYTLMSAVFSLCGISYMLLAFALEPPLGTVFRVLPWILTPFVVVAVVAITGKVFLIGGILRKLRQSPLFGKAVKFEDGAVRDTEEILFGILHDRPWRLRGILFFEFAAQVILVLEVFAFLSAGLPVSFDQPVLIEASTKWVSFLFFFVPGQLGASEGVYALIFTALGLPSAAGFALALARRLRTLLLAALVLIFVPNPKIGSTE